MPEVPTPFVNGQVVGSPALHASRSILSFAPATRMFVWLASTAIAGSFCLFCENGVVGLPTLTRTLLSGTIGVAIAMTTPAAISVIAAGMRKCDRRRVRVNRLGFFIYFLSC